MKRVGRICDKPRKPLNIQARNVMALVWIMESSGKYPRNEILENGFSFFFLNFIKNSFESFFLVVDVFCEEKVHGQESVSPRAVVVQRYVLPIMHEKCPHL